MAPTLLCAPHLQPLQQPYCCARKGRHLPRHSTDPCTTHAHQFGIDAVQRLSQTSTVTPNGRLGPMHARPHHRPIPLTHLLKRVHTHATAPLPAASAPARLHWLHEGPADAVHEPVMTWTSVPRSRCRPLPITWAELATPHPWPRPLPLARVEVSGMDCRSPAYSMYLTHSPRHTTLVAALLVYSTSHLPLHTP